MSINASLRCHSLVPRASVLSFDSPPWCVSDNVVFSARAGAMAGLCHVRAVPPSRCAAGLQRIGGTAHGRGQADVGHELVAGLLTLVHR